MPECYRQHQDVPPILDVCAVQYQPDFDPRPMGEQVFWNHHKFERGKRAGSSPLELAGVEDAPSLVAVLDQLFCPSLSAQPT